MIEKHFENLYLTLWDSKRNRTMQNNKDATAFVLELDKLCSDLWSTRFGTTNKAIERLMKLDRLPVGKI